MRVKFHPEARTDLREGSAFYSHRSPIAAVAFADTIDACIKKIAESPLTYPVASTVRASSFYGASPTRSCIA